MQRGRGAEVQRKGYKAKVERELPDMQAKQAKSPLYTSIACYDA